MFGILSPIDTNSRSFTIICNIIFAKSNPNHGEHGVPGEKIKTKTWWSSFVF